MTFVRSSVLMGASSTLENRAARLSIMSPLVAVIASRRAVTIWPDAWMSMRAISSRQVNVTGLRIGKPAVGGDAQQREMGGPGERTGIVGRGVAGDGVGEGERFSAPPERAFALDPVHGPHVLVVEREERQPQEVRLDAHHLLRQRVGDGRQRLRDSVSGRPGS